MCELPTEAVAFLLIRKDNFLAEKRRIEKEAYPGMTAVPGGRMEPGETQEQTLFREMEEELSVKPKKWNYLFSIEDPMVYNGLMIHYYHVPEWEGIPVPGEAEELIWMSIFDPDRIDVRIDREAVNRFLELYL